MRVSKHRAPVVAQLVDVLERHAHRLRDVALRQAERLYVSSIRISPTLAGLRFVISMACLIDSYDCRDTRRTAFSSRRAAG